MKIKVSVLIAIVSVLFKLNVQAQEKSIQQGSTKPTLQLGAFKADYTYSPFNVNGEDVQAQQANTSLIFPLYSKLKDGKLDFLLAGIGYTGLFLSGNNTELGASAFHSLSIPISYQKSLSTRYSFSVTFIPTLSSDLKDISGEDMIYTGAAAFKVKVSERFSYSLGAVYSKQFFGALLLPLVGIDWQINNKLNLSGSLPVSQRLKYSLSAKNALGINNNLGIGGGTYRLSEEMNAAYFQAQQSKISLFYNYMPSKNFSIEFNAGYNYVQKLGIYNKDQKIDLAPFDSLDDRIPLRELNKTGISVGVGINYLF
ncbi:DUF6268 family outer membrane beta-barrel protein [Pedobacter sp. N23S346]|uniref:DUF6268 family outer membrane beta-barrel protein n=1 Tax=Pedobacter sp. N23S346 TaxID=3402750 RepID=UPI003AC4A8D1